jgi:hypothetical protein
MYASAVTETPTPSEVMPPPKKPWVIHAVWAAIVLVPLTFLTIVLAMSKPAEGQCSGIGWGCELTGTDAAAIFLIIIGIPVAVIWLAGHGIIAFVQWRKRNRSASLTSS